jgi:DNA-binding transcriptional LysR family regulator
MNLLTSLRYLVALSEHRHFARAAQACHITQPALSNALRTLEAEFGTEIVKRGRTYAGLTAEGERILVSARRMLHEHEQLQQELAARSAEPQGKLRLGVVPTAMPVAAHFAARLREAHPGISVVVRSSSSLEIENGLQDLTLDLGLGFIERQTGGRPRFEVVPQYEERYFLLRRASGTGLVIGPPCGWKEAARLPLCLLTPEMHHRQIVDAAFAQAAVEVRPAMETNSISALVLGVAGGDLCSVVPGALAATAPAGVGLEALPLVRPVVGTPVGFLLLAKATPSRVLQAALEIAGSAAWHKDVQTRTGRLRAC